MRLLKALLLILALAGPMLTPVPMAQATVNEVTAVNRYVGNGSTTVFSYTFKILTKNDIEVIVDDTVKTVDTHYSVSGLGASGGGSVTFIVAPLNAAKVTLLRKQPASQLSVYTPNEPFPAVRLEKDFDKLVMEVQQAREQLLRGLFFNKKTTFTGGTLDDFVAGKYARVNAGATGLEWVDLTVSGAYANPITTKGDVLVGGATGLASRLGVGADGTIFEADSTQSTGLKWGTPPIKKDLIDAKGDIVVGTAADTTARKAVGADGTALIGLAASSDGLYYQPGVLNGAVLRGGKFTVTMSGNAVTIAIKTDAGNNPSATEPVWAWFRHATLTDGSSVLVPITAATSTVISSGSTGGTVSGQASRVYVDLINNAGTAELAWHQTLSGINLLGFHEAALVSTTAEGGAGAADSAGVMYSTTARSSVAFRIVGYFESTQATAGTWATNASLVQPMGPGVRRTGDIVQIVSKEDGNSATGTTTLPNDNTIPQNTEGDEFIATPSITPSSAINLLRARAVIWGATSVTGNTLTAAMFDGSANAIAAGKFDYSDPGIGSRMRGISLAQTKVAGSTTGRIYSIRMGGPTAGTWTFNGQAGGGWFGGVAISSLWVEEVFV
jgi:hypothetical protein